jgi:hypothetical protein
MFRRYGIRLMEEAAMEGASAGGLGDGGAPQAEDITPEATVDEGVDLSNVPAWARELKVDAEILQDPSLKAINDLDSLAKSYVHAQRKIGQKGVILPGENSTQEEWDTFYQKTGVPLEEQEYGSQVNFGESGEKTFDENFNADFVKKAHELRIRPDQASQMYKFFNEQANTTAEHFQAENAEKQQAALNELRDSLGEDAYNVRLSKASQLINEELGAEFNEYLQKSGLGKDAKVVEAFMKLANKMYGEEKIPTQTGGSVMTKDQMQNEINLAMGNFDDPYHKPNHPDHQRRVKEIQKFFAKLEK